MENGIIIFKHNNLNVLYIVNIDLASGMQEMLYKLTYIDHCCWIVNRMSARFKEINNSKYNKQREQNKNQRLS